MEVPPVFIFMISLNLMLVLQMALLMFLDCSLIQKSCFANKTKCNLFFLFVLLTSDCFYTSAVTVLDEEHPSSSLWCVEF